MSLERFHEAQASRSAGYDTALAEIRRGRKTSHWDLVYLPAARRPRPLLPVPRLSIPQSAFRIPQFFRPAPPRPPWRAVALRVGGYEEITAAVSDQLGRGLALEDLMGSRIDALKLVSCLTLFRAAADQCTKEERNLEPLAQLCDTLLAKAAAEGFPACVYTLSRLTGDEL